jgi:outer membrane protein TolC
MGDPNRHTLGVGWLAGLCLGAMASAAEPTDKLPDLNGDPAPGMEAAIPQVPVSIERAMDLAFARNPDLRAAAERIGEAEARVKEAMAAFYPEVTARVSYTHSNDPARAFSMIVAQRRFSFTGVDINNPGYQQDFRPEIGTTWSLYRGGQDLARKRAAELGVEVSTLDRAAARNQLAAAVASAFYTLAAAPEQVKVAEHSIASVESGLKQAKARLSEGTGLRSDVLSLEVRLAQAKETKLRAENAEELARTALKTLLALSTDTPLEIRAESESSPPPAAQEFPRLLKEALAERPEMRAAAKQLEMRGRELDAEKGAHLPRVNAIALYGQNHPDPDLSLNRDNFTVGVTAEIDLFTGQRTSARIAAAEHRLAEAKALQDRTRLDIEKEVKEAHLIYQEALARMKVAEAAVGAAEEALRLVSEQYWGGTATVTRYLETETARVEARSNVIAARYEAQSAWAGVKRATGFWK